MAFPNASPTIRRALPILALLLWLAVALVHVVTGSDQAFVEQYIGRQRLVFTYLDAKHMVTGYDHLLFLFDVCFFLYRMRDVGAYVAFLDEVRKAGDCGLEKGRLSAGAGAFLWRQSAAQEAACT